MTDSSNLVQKQLSDLAWQVVHIIEDCKEEKEILQEQFNSVKNTILILEACLGTERQRIDSKVSGVCSQMDLHHAVLQQVHLGIGIMRSHDNDIVEDSSSTFSRINQELQSLSKRISDNTIQILAVKGTMSATQKMMKTLTTKIDSVNKILASITKSLAGLPSIKEPNNHASSMADQVAQMPGVNTGLTTAMER